MQQQILVFGEPVKTLPKDLYIPPEALRVLLETFEGPLDLLLYLIRKQNMDILDIEVSLITEQYLAYMEMMQALDIDLAAEYLLMAATLAEIKARMMLPQRHDAESQEPDPRAELADRLLIYAQTLQLAERLADLARLDAGFALSAQQAPAGIVPIIKPARDVNKLQQMLAAIYERQALRRAHEVEREAYSLAERVEMMENRLQHQTGWHALQGFYHSDEGRPGLVVSLMAMLELDRAQVLEWRQEDAFAEVLLRARQAA
ncbi:segregation and condensation protein A [Suttonella indologenes]|uniref:Segregation and condensation protein A n=1 Tax=Suttonella indologenes TaxID=13276 RepID=A0A380MJN1_9GAMM|nr:segregation/condensation protein A [Suttonella indologenes]SUO92032.1 Segregation and condensation protein A [Suttonella indologenes]